MRNEGVISNDSEIDLRVISRFLNRNKFKLICTATVGLLISVFIQKISPKIWKGQFQIVLNTKNKSNDSIASGIAEQFADFNLKKSKNDLLTQIEILTSPSVLLEIFEYVKDKKSVEDNSFKNTSFLDWKENLKVELIEKTSVLDLSYLDKDKSLILPVLDKISNKYISYNTNKSEESIQNQLSFYNDQLNIYQLRSINSYKEAQQFAIDNDFIFNFDLNSNRKFSDDSVERIRVDNSNQIKFLREKYKHIESMNSDSDEILHFANTANGLVKINPLLLAKINEIDSAISDLRNIYREEDIAILSLKEQKSELVRSLKNDIIGSFKSEILDKQAVVSSYRRPKEILLKYSSLINQAKRDDETLKRLEDQIRYLSLEVTKKDFPWDLITKPTLLPYPYAPYKNLYYLLGTTLGLLGGGLYAFGIEKKNDIFFDTEDVENTFTFPVLEEYSTLETDSLDKKVKLISSNPRIIPLKNIGIFYANNNKENEKKIIESFTNVFKDKVINLSTNIRDLPSSTLQIIVVELGITKKSNLINQLNKLLSNEISILGFLVIK